MYVEVFLAVYLRVRAARRTGMGLFRRARPPAGGRRVGARALLATALLRSAVARARRFLSIVWDSRSPLVRY